MKYRIKIGDNEITITDEQYEDLYSAISNHEAYGFRDGHTRWHSVVITEVGIAASHD